MVTWLKNRGSLRSNAALLFALMLLLVCSPVPAMAQNYTNSTAAGTSITNSATVTYTDGNGQSYSKTSSAVTVYVQQRNAFVLTPGTATITGVANQVMQQQFTLTNNANGTEVVKLSLADLANTDLNGAQMYASNAGGTAPDLTKPIANGTNVTLTQGQTLTFWVQGTLAAAASKPNGVFHVYAIDQPALIPNPFGGGNWDVPAAYNDESSLPSSANNGASAVTVNITAGAVVQISKSFDQSSGTGGTLRVTFTIQNQGTTDSGRVNLSDELAGTGFAYVPGTARFVATPFSSDTNGTASSSGINATVNVTGTRIDATFDRIPNSSSQTYAFSFDVAVSATTPGTYTNTGRFNYQNGGIYTPAGTSDNTCSTAAASCLPTSTATYQLLQTYSFEYPSGSTINTLASGNSAQVLYYVENVHNSGTGTDTYTLSNNLGTFPAGTTFTYYYNNAGVPGGPLPLVSGTVGQVGAVYSPNAVPAGGDFSYIIAVQLPPNTVGGPFTMTATASGKVGIGAAAAPTAKTDTITLTSAVLPLDLHSNVTTGTFATAAGLGPGPEASAQTTSAVVTPPNSYTFQLWVKNNQSIADNFKVVASNSTTFGATDTLPAGWTVNYALPGGADCSTLGAPLNAAGTPVAANTPKLVCAQITPPANHAPGTVAIYFRVATTDASGSFDAIHDAVAIGTVHNVVIDSLAQGVQAGAAAIYKNTITNNGNVPETVYFAAGYTTDTPTPAAGVFGSTVYTDAALTTPVVAAPNGGYTQLTVAPGATVNIWVQVTTSSGNQPGWSNATALVITYNAGANTATGTNITTITSAIQNISVTKTQALDASCAGDWNVLTFAAAAVKAKPGECVAYRITAVNSTGATISSVQVNDSLNATWVTYCDGTTCGSVPAGQWTSLSGATEESGTGSWTAPTLTSNKLTNVTNSSTVVFTFEVKVK